MPDQKPLKWIEIDLAAIRSNIEWTASRLDRGVRLMAIVKADAYGHGAPQVAREAAKAGASSLGVLTLHEASRLREAGAKLPIHVLAPILPEQAPLAVKLGVSLTVDDVAQLAALQRAAGARAVAVHADVDLGLGRWGLAPKNVEPFVDALGRFKKLRLEGLSAHVDYVPGKNSVECEEKLRSFQKLAQKLKARFPKLVCHAANSSVLMDFPHWQLDMVRVGNLIYGVNRARTKPAELARPFQLWGRIISLHDVTRGKSIGYASEYVAARSMRVATLPVGYADGLTMEPAERLIGFGSGFQYWGMLRGKKAPFVGRCGIAHVLVDVTDCRDARLGDAVALPVRRTAASAQLPRYYR